MRTTSSNTIGIWPLKDAKPLEPSVTVKDIDTAPIALPVNNEIDWQQKFNEQQSKLFQVADENFKLKEENSNLRQNLTTKSALDALINPYASKSYWFMVLYSMAVGAILLLQGFKAKGFALPEGVLNFLVGSTAATVIGLVGMVLTGVFIGRNPKS
jgi:hypothetical protein